ncbi:MAG: YdbL family protein [Planctomycetes bacterium]|nr:YdbL family protein [Planctomycetota bacterium]
MHRAKVLTAILGLVLAASDACASDEIDLDVSTAAIDALRVRIKERADAIAKHKDFGQLGEARDGLLAVRTLEGVKLSDKKAIEDLVEAENTDRRALYREILKANDLKDEDADAVMKVAARRHRKSAAPGHWVQEPAEGKWTLARELKE